MKLLLLSVSVVLCLLFYTLERFGVEEFGGLSHIALTGLTVFLPFFNVRYSKGCNLKALGYSSLVFLPVLVLKFDIITLITITVYTVVLSTVICNKHKRREVETED